MRGGVVEVRREAVYRGGHEHRPSEVVMECTFVFGVD